MRTRNKTDVLRRLTRPAHNVLESHAFCTGLPATATDTISVPAADIPTDYVNSRMIDATGRKVPHPVLHRSLSVKLDEGESVVFANTVSGRNCTTSYAPSTAWVAWNASEASGPFGWDLTSLGGPPNWTISATGINEQSLINDVKEKASQLKADVLLNVVEANQIWPSLLGLAQSLPLLRKDWKVIRKLIKSVSGGYLAWKFGISPILQDVMAINRYLPKLGADIKKHGDGQAQRFSRIAGLKPVFLRADTVASTYKLHPSGESIEDPTIRYVLVVKPIVQYQTDFFKSLDTCMKRFATSPASLAWEKVPFSFVLDWFVDIRAMLGKLDSLLGFEPYKVLSFTRSYKFVLKSSQEVTLFSNCSGGSQLQQWRMFDNVYRHYDRSLVSNGSYWPVWKPRFGKNQAGISAALIGQKLSAMRSTKLWSK